MTEVTVVIPTRNRRQVLEAAGLAAARLQEDVDLEIVVVDDGSEDGTADFLRALDDDRVRVIRRGLPQGVAAARNAGIEAARGAWIAFLDDDDLWSPRKLRTQLDTAASDGASFVYAGVAVVDGLRQVLDVTVPAAKEIEELLERNTVPAGSSNVLVRTTDVRAVGGFDEGLTYVADWDLWIRLAGYAHGTVSPEVLVAYVRQGDGMRFGGRRAVVELRSFVAKHEQNGLRADPARFLRWIASEDRIAGRRLSAASTYARNAVAFRQPRDLVHAAATLLHLEESAPNWPNAGDVEIPWLACYG